MPTDLTKCRKRTKYLCKCGPVCKVCGYGEHMAIHAGKIDNPNEVYGHEFEPAIRALVGDVDKLEQKISETKLAIKVMKRVQSNDEIAQPKVKRKYTKKNKVGKIIPNNIPPSSIKAAKKVINMAQKNVGFTSYKISQALGYDLKFVKLVLKTI